MDNYKDKTPLFLLKKSFNSFITWDSKNAQFGIHELQIPIISPFIEVFILFQKYITIEVNNYLIL